MNKFDFRSFIKDATLEKLENQKSQILKESYEYRLANKASRDYVLDEDLLFEQVMLSEDILEEGIWSKIKHFGAKVVGSAEKGGKLFGRKEQERKAIAQYEKMLEKTVDGLLKKFMAIIEKEYPGFPNMESEEEFNTAVAEIYTFYDAISQAALSPEDMKNDKKAIKAALDVGKMDPTTANAIIRDMRVMMSKILDYDLADAYKHFDESLEQDGEQLEEIFGKRGWEKEAEKQEKEEAEAAAAAEADGEEEASEDENVLSGDEGGDSASMKSMKSNVLPAVLGLVGASGVLGALLMKAGWFTAAVPKPGSPPAAVKTAAAKIVNSLSPDPGEGVTQMLGRIVNGNAASLDANATWGDLVKAMKSVGIADPNNPTELTGLAMDPKGFLPDWTASLNKFGGPGGVPANTPLGDLFPGSGLGPKGALGLKLGKAVVIPIIKASAKSGAGAVAGAGAGAAAAKTGMAASTGLGLIGLAAGSVAAAIKLLRLKGQKSSRLEKLQKLRNAMKDIQGAPEIIDNKPDDNPGDDDEFERQDTEEIPRDNAGGGEEEIPRDDDDGDEDFFNIVLTKDGTIKITALNKKSLREEIQLRLLEKKDKMKAKDLRYKKGGKDWKQDKKRYSIQLRKPMVKKLKKMKSSKREKLILKYIERLADRGKLGKFKAKHIMHALKGKKGKSFRFKDKM
jgi:hypothetical protein